jgi:putative heme-binding domain-containing protein
MASGADTDSKNPTVAGTKDQSTQSAIQAKQVANRTNQFYKEWKMDDLLPAVTNLAEERDFKQGNEVFRQAMCATCHALGRISQGNGFSPDLTGVGSKYTRDIILESILQPSAVISGQYYITNFRRKNGGVVQGTLVDIVDGNYVIASSPLRPDETISVPQADIASEEPSSVSPMPEGLLNVFTKEQILDLFAFLEAQGNPDASIFKKQEPTSKN